MPLDPVTAQLIGQGLGATAEAVKPPPLPPMAYNGRTTINIVPPTTNLGEILAQFAGPVENGGAGSFDARRYQPPAPFSPLVEPVPNEVRSVPYLTYAALGIAGIGAVYLFTRGG